MAYALKGAKTQFHFSLLFFIVSFLFIKEFWLRKSFSLPKNLIFPHILFLFWSLISLLNNPPYFIYFAALSKIILYTLFSLWVSQYRTRDLSSHFGWILVCLGLIESSLILFGQNSIQAFGGWLGNPLHSGLLIPAGLSFLAYQLLDKQKSIFRKLLLVGVLFFMLAALIALRSRSAIFGFLIGVLLVYPISLSSKFFLALVATFLLIFGLQFTEGGFYALKLSWAGLGSTLGRFSIWKTALVAFLHHPTLGVGLGNFEFAYFSYQQPSLEILRYGKSTIFAHNGLLQIMVEIGLPGVVFLLIGFFRIIQGNIRPKLKKEDSFIFLILFIFVFTSLFNYSLFLPFNGLIFSFCIGYLLAIINKKQETNLINLQKYKFPVVYFVTFLLLFSLANGFSELLKKSHQYKWALRLCPIRADIWYEWAKKDLENNPELVKNKLQKALLWNSTDPFIWATMSRFLFTSNFDDKKSAGEALQKALELAPSHCPFWIQKGFLSLQRGSVLEAREAFEKAATLEPLVPLPYYGLGFCSIKLNQHEKAAEYFKKAHQRKEAEIPLKDLSGTNRELIESNYGKFLFSIPIKMLSSQ